MTFVVFFVLLVFMSSCITPVVETQVPTVEIVLLTEKFISTTVQTEITLSETTLTPTEEPTPTKTPTPEPTATLTPVIEHLSYPMTWAGVILTELIRDVPGYESMIVERCSKYANGWEPLSNLPAVIYQGETWAESYCLDSVEIDREPGGSYSYFGFVFECHNIRGIEDGYYLYYVLSDFPRDNVDGKKGEELWSVIGLKKEYFLSKSSYMAPVFAFGIESEVFAEYISSEPFLWWE